ncbi:chloramphenicol acetyltransferase [Caldalkalibacillus mannanilyticus]|uniref:chloramphenicol acetyltransferase n=1 Tax=Caldalkalibacillus mannanilyticus TaxID=1418 RepID=UPI00046AFE4D|nr:chloramphenicol acetyltransferase CAT [Caldalkalibacillus mannanilyticus]
MEAKFTPIDLQTWPRGQMFYYFTKMSPAGYSMTVDLDVTRMRLALKERKLKFFPAYLWLTTKIVNKQVEFKVALNNEVLGYWDVLTPLYATFHEDDKTFSFMWTEYHDCFSAFYESYVKNQEQYGKNHGVLAQPDRLPPANSYVVSCLPWVEFKHFSFHSYENKDYFFPTIEAGKFHESNGRVLLPLSITVHHATTDGWHIKNFLDELQYEMNHPEKWM